MSITMADDDETGIDTDSQEEILDPAAHEAALRRRAMEVEETIRTGSSLGREESAAAIGATRYVTEHNVERARRRTSTPREAISDFHRR